MKQLKSILGELRRLFERTVTLRDIAEPLVSFDGDHDAQVVRHFMLNHSFDTVGVREQGHVRGYVMREELESLRNELAHSADIIQGRWPELADRAEDAWCLLQSLECASLLGNDAAPG